MKSLAKALKTSPVCYITRDIERALGLPQSTPNYYIITNWTPFAKTVTSQNKNILLIKEPTLLDTRNLLAHPKTKHFLSKIQNIKIVVFKNTTLIEQICRQNNWPLLNPDAKIADTVEGKITGYHWLKDLRQYLPPSQIQTCQNLQWIGEKFIIQFNHAHTGSGTILIETAEQLKKIQEQFPRRDVRVSQYIEGATLTNNNIVWNNRILIGNINYQITGFSPFTQNVFATIGNDWALPRKILNTKQINEYQKIATAVGKQLSAHGWRGLFGIDTIVDAKTGRIFLIEINARQPASTTYESHLQQKTYNKNNLTTFEAHMAALLKLPTENLKLVTIVTGAQITLKVQPRISKINPQTIAKLQNSGINLISYNNKKSEQDLLRIQSAAGIMQNPQVFNYIGTSLSYIIDPARHTYRAGLIIIKNDKLLTIKRIVKGRQYYTLPGGKPKTGETLKEAAIREGREETGLHFTIDSKKEPFCVEHTRRQIYFFTQNITGHAKLGGPEKTRSRKNNFYALEWLPIQQLRNLPLLPGHLSTLLKLI